MIIIQYVDLSNVYTGLQGNASKYAYLVGIFRPYYRLVCLSMHLHSVGVSYSNVTMCYRTVNACPYPNVTIIVHVPMIIQM